MAAAAAIAGTGVPVDEQALAYAIFVVLAAIMAVICLLIAAKSIGDGISGF